MKSSENYQKYKNDTQYAGTSKNELKQERLNGQF